MTSPFRVAIAGLGFGAAVHVPAFRTLEDVEIVAIAGRGEEKARRMADALGIPAGVADFRSLLDFSPDAVTIALPPTENAIAAAFFLSHGVPVVCEKPIAGDIGAARRLVKLSSAVTHAVDFQFAELPAFLSAKEALENKWIGQVRHINITWLVESYANRHQKMTWKRMAASAGGVMSLLAPHVFYLSRWLFGPISTISSRLSNGGKASMADDSLAPDVLQFWAELESGATLSAIISNNSPEMHIHRWELVGESGALIIENTTHDYMTGFSTRLVDRQGERWLTKASTNNALDGRVSPFASLAKRFISAVLLNKQTYPTFEDGWRAQCVLDVALTSHMSRQIVSLPNYSNSR